jgi:predicted adenylyl cyclase CyaB
VSQFETIRIENPSKFKSLLAGAIGNRAVVRKNRLVFMYGCTRIHLDEVENLGSFIELEVPIGESHQTARKTMDLLVKEFQIGHEDYLRCSYADMLLVNDSSGVLHSSLKEKD